MWTPPMWKPPRRSCLSDQLSDQRCLERTADGCFNGELKYDFHDESWHGVFFEFIDNCLQMGLHTSSKELFYVLLI